MLCREAHRRHCHEAAERRPSRGSRGPIQAGVGKGEAIPRGSSQPVHGAWLHYTGPKAIHMSEYGLAHLHISVGWQRGFGRAHSANSKICTCCYRFLSLNQRENPVVDDHKQLLELGKIGSAQLDLNTCGNPWREWLLCVAWCDVHWGSRSGSRFCADAHFDMVQTRIGIRIRIRPCVGTGWPPVSLASRQLYPPFLFAFVFVSVCIWICENLQPMLWVLMSMAVTSRVGRGCGRGSAARLEGRAERREKRE